MTEEKNNKSLSILAVAIIGILGLGLVSAYGMGMGFGFGNDELTDEEILQIQEDREAMRTAIQNNDYQAWEGLMQDRLAILEDQINEDTFEEMYNRHLDREEFHEAVEALKESGEFSREKMLELREEYGIQGQGMHKGFNKGFRNEMMQGYGECPMLG